MHDGNVTTPEHRRLREVGAGEKKWRKWGPYLSERQWGTVREDYSEGGDAWRYFPFDHANSRAYRWGEDGLLGMLDNRGLFAFAPALWNGKDPILKERLFGLSGPEGNHGEDVKESYWYLDSTPTHSFCRGLYKYPQREFPYKYLREKNGSLTRNDPEVDLIDTGIFKDNRYFDVEVLYAKADVDDILIELIITNRGPDQAPLTVLPTFWARNTWSWGEPDQRPKMSVEPQPDASSAVLLEHFHLGRMHIYFDGTDELVFTDNETNLEVIWNSPNRVPFTKDAFQRYIVEGKHEAVNPAKIGTKMAGVFRMTMQPGETRKLRMRMSAVEHPAPFAEFDAIVELRRDEANTFYQAVTPIELSTDEAHVYRQALAGLLWSKQFYHLDVTRWLRGDPGQPKPPHSRLEGRNASWGHLFNSEVISMPDKWEYPWYAAWDTAFHTLPMAIVDPDLAKAHLSLFLREWYMHPNGQIPAYEWSFGDVNPPVHAWAALRVYDIEKRQCGKGDRQFLEGVFHKLMLNFTWWVNRKDSSGRNVFEGGFLGLDNIGVFDRSSALPTGGKIEQADATSWMGMYCLNLLEIALELARENRVYEDVANKFFEHFLYIASAMNQIGGGDGDESVSLWDEQDGFFYDWLNLGEARIPMRVRSMVGLIPLFGSFSVDPATLDAVPGFVKRMRWFLSNRPELARHAAQFEKEGSGGRRLLSLVSERRLLLILARVLDESEFLSPHGIRALSRFHHDHPYVFEVDGREHRVDYEPAESRSHIFGGNSNWRGPVWFPVNYLLIESLRERGLYYGERLLVECPRGSGRMLTLTQIAEELSLRLCSIFVRQADGRRPVFGDNEQAQNDPHFRDHVLFYEYFHGDNGMGLGAAHQTGWTALVAQLFHQRTT